MEPNDLRQKALEAIDQVAWIPRWGRERIYRMVENRPDWCISRQRAWGVPIVAFHCQECGEVFLTQEILAGIITGCGREGADFWFAEPGCRAAAAGARCPLRRRGVRQGDGHPGRLVRLRGELGRGAGARPGPGLARGPLSGRLGPAPGLVPLSLLDRGGHPGPGPLPGVLTHGFVVDGEGRKMSKSLGNVIAPQEVMKKYGAEILRLWVSAEDYRDDVRLSR